MDAMGPADVLEAAADALLVYGRCWGEGTNDAGELCVRGAVLHVTGGNPKNAIGMYGYPAIVALDAYLATHPEAFAPAAREWYAETDAALIETGRFPSFIWNDRLQKREDDAHVIDTLRLCAKDLRNEATA